MDTKWNGTEPENGGEVEYFVAAQVRQTIEPEAAEGPAPKKRGQTAKAAAGFLAFFLGITLVLGSLGALAERRLMQRGAEPDWSGDWQNTQEFRDEVSSYLMEFLSLGATGTTGNAWYQTAEAWDVAEAGGWRRQYTEIILTDTAAESRPVEEEEEALTAREAEGENAYRTGDQNVLYLIMQDGHIRYKNVEADSAKRFRDQSLEGYNFYLTYQDGKASIFKDGVELDVYGDGIYVSGKSPWFIPGYDNLKAGAWLDGVTVYMAVREEPVRYWFQDSGGGRYYYGRMYQVAQRAEEARTFYIRQLVLLGLGALWLCVWLAFRREKKLADAKIASWTGHLWEEVWVLLALIPLGWLFAADGWQELYWACREIWWGWEPVYLGQLAYGAASFLLSSLPGLIALGWVLYLAVNNRRYNPKEQRKSLLRSLFRGLRNLLCSLRMKDLERPVEKRLARTVTAGTAALALILAALVLFLAAMLPDIAWYGARGLAFILFLLVLALGVLALLVSSARSLRLGRDLGRLNRQIESIRAGDLSTPLDLPEDADLRKTAEALNDIQAGMRTALAEQTRSERMKVELISNVSHDLKTPLTSILSYAELLRQEDLPPAAADYARVIDEKAQRLKTMVQDVFEVSKAAADQLPVSMERLDLGKLLRQTLADLDDPIQKSGLTFKTDLPAEPVMIDADGKRLYRVFQNLIDNALRYALEGSRVYLTLKTAERAAEAAGLAQVSVRNTSRDELPEGVDFTARFVRGDESRTDGGSGLGLSIASSFTEACGGTFQVETVADLFTAVVTFPLAETEQEAER
ncbi:MAG: HAMP domain-containing sensor histidine kinase [Dysosmobacter sp.]|uniref:sensor histidine kinase n=1 Tax=uncultured Oscillibacter sp. TaxID=876091 RepID=UPI002607E3DE|nr:HAMP domain-containing sensor histidine kinase [uncultured Oscillibacter sp.]MCX4372673.1 HAMP domain-containing sensor histidine kinase [Dysosmobacter sp.]